MSEQIKDLEKAIREYLPEVIHMSLATSKDNKPWVCEVHYAYDEDLNFYFMSTAQRRHSVEISENPNVSGNIVKQHGMKDKPRGIYFEGVAEMLSEVYEEHPAYISYKKRFGLDKSDIVESRLETGHKFYKITVSKFYVFDAIESSPSQKYKLDWKSNHK